MAVYDELRIGKEKIINRFEIYPLLGGEILWGEMHWPARILEDNLPEVHPFPLQRKDIILTDLDGHTLVEY